MSAGVSLMRPTAMLSRRWPALPLWVGWRRSHRRRLWSRNPGMAGRFHPLAGPRPCGVHRRCRWRGLCKARHHDRHAADPPSTASTALSSRSRRNSTIMSRPKKRFQREQDGSEVKSVQLETLIGAGQSLIERRRHLSAHHRNALVAKLRSRVNFIAK